MTCEDIWVFPEPCRIPQESATFVGSVRKTLEFTGRQLILLPGWVLLLLLLLLLLLWPLRSQRNAF